MRGSRSHMLHLIAFLTLFVVINLVLDGTGLRPKMFNALVDSLTLATGLGARFVEILIVGGCAFICQWVITVLWRAVLSLTAERERALRLSISPSRRPADD